jgi:hypothetical protein
MPVTTFFEHTELTTNHRVSILPQVLDTPRYSISSLRIAISSPTIISKGANFMAIAQQNHRLLALVIFFAILATILLSVLWFEGGHLLNGFWHTVNGVAYVAVMSHRP